MAHDIGEMPFQIRIDFMTMSALRKKGYGYSEI